MKITICGSMHFYEAMKTVKSQLEAFGHEVFIPSGAIDLGKNEALVETDEERILVKIEHDVIREHFRLIESSEAILILNYEKNGVAGYIGGNTFLEMGVAFRLGKKIYLLNPIPDMDYVTEMRAMQPNVLNGELQKIT